MKLSVKLAVYITILALISSMFVSVLSYFEIKARVNEQVEDYVLSLVSTVSSTASTSAYINDETLATEVVNGLQLNEVIRCASIRSSDLNIMSSADCAGDVTLTKDLYSPWDEQEVVGYIKVYKSKQHIDELVQEQFVSALLTLVQVILIVSALILMLTHFFITSPISNVSKRLDRVNFEEDIDLLGEGIRKDEIGHISRVINLMMVNAKKQIINEKIFSRKTQEFSNHFRLIFQLSKNNLAVTDQDLNVKSFNPRFKDLVLSVVPNADLNGKKDWIESVTDDTGALLKHIDTVKEFEVPTTIEVGKKFTLGGEEHRRFYNLTFVKSRSGGQEDANVTILFFIVDMTEHKNRLEKTEYEANHDNLTKLLNRRAATRMIRYGLSAKEEHDQMAIMFIDLDGFKPINDQYGHDAGDVLLREVGLRILRSVRKTDIPCRWGGDEFLVALNQVSLAEATGTANKILKEIVKPVVVPNAEGPVNIGASIGIVLSTPEVSDFQTLYDCADKAMYRVKKSGKNAVLVHSI